MLYNCSSTKRALISDVHMNRSFVNRPIRFHWYSLMRLIHLCIRTCIFTPGYMSRGYIILAEEQSCGALYSGGVSATDNMNAL